SVELRLQIVGHRGIRSVLQVAIAIAEIAVIAAAICRVVAGLEGEVVQIGSQDALAVVVVHLATIEQGVADGQIEEVGVRVAAAGLRRRQIAVAIGVDDHVDHGMIDSHVVEIPLAMQNGNYAHSDVDVVNLQQGLIKAWTDAINGKSIEIEAEIGEVQGKVLQGNARVQRSAGLLFHRVQDIVVHAGAVQRHV